MKTISLSVAVSNNNVTLQTKGITLTFNIESIEENIDSILYIGTKIFKDLSIDEYKLEELKLSLSVMKDTLKSCDFTSELTIDEDGQLTTTFNGKISYNIIQLMSRLDFYF